MSLKCLLVYQARKKKETRRYGPLRGPTSSSCGGLHPSSEAFFALLEKRTYYAVLAHFRPFWSSVVTLVTFTRNLNDSDKINVNKLNLNQ